MQLILCLCGLIFYAYGTIDTTIPCSTTQDCLNDCTRNAMCNDFCSYSNYKDEGRFCLTEDYAFSTCNDNGICDNIEEGLIPVADDETTPCESSERHRKPWHMISDEERDLYITGFKALYEKGVIEKFTSTHGSHTTLYQAHATSAFLPWHRYFLWEIETQIRNLGGKYRCFSMPWWDSTDETTRESDYYILTSGLGGSGEEESNYCVENGPFARGKYIPSVCDGFDEGEECCLQRDTISWTNSRFLTPQETLKYITDYGIYGNDNINSDDRIDGFGRNVEGKPHGPLHVVIGGSGHLGQVAKSPDDPIFYLLHTSIDMLWALWQDCYNYDQVLPDEITEDIYYGLGLQESSTGVVYGPSGIDDKLVFADVEDEEWSLVNTIELTPRDLHDIRAWDVSYEKGDFYERANVDELEDNICMTINPEWFYNTIANEGKPQSPAEIFADDTFTFLKYKQFQQQRPSDESDTERNRVILNSWAVITCEYNEFSLDKPCYRPRYFADCASDPKYQGVDGDIDISLDELLERVSDSECMMETRRVYYEWAKNSRRLMDLCNGIFDQFCDNQFLKDTHVQSVIRMNAEDNNEVDELCTEISFYRTFSIIGGIIICLLVLTIIGMILYIQTLKKSSQKSYILEQEMVSYYGTTPNKESD